MKKLKILILLLAVTGLASAQVQSIHDIFCSHYASSKDTGLSKACSQTNSDSVFYRLVGRTGTIGDSSGDSLIMPLPVLNQRGGYMQVGVVGELASDTALDSMIVYENNVPLYRAKIVKQVANDLYFPFVIKFYSTFVQNQKFVFKPKWKQITGKLTKRVRIVPNYIAQ